MYNKTFPVYCICLPQRKKNTRDFFKALNIKPIYTPIVLKNNLNQKQLIDYNIISNWYNFKSNKGRIACAISHYNAIIQFIKSKYPYCLIFEDDNKIPTEKEVKHIHNVLDEILPLKIWNIINLSPCYRACGFQKTHTQTSYLKYPLLSTCANAYAITKKGAEEYLERLFPLTYFKYASDHDFMHITNSYDCAPRLFEQNIDEFDTTIDNTDQKNDCINYDIKIVLIVIFVLILIIIKLIKFKK